MLAEVVDGVIGADTHRDTNQVEIARPSGAVITTHSFSARFSVPRQHRRPSRIVTGPALECAAGAG
jgi:hypothetical protein